MAESLGMPLDEWQEQALEAAMGERADGRWASKFVGMSVPRQNGKSQIIVARALAGVLLFGEKMIIISAHETDTAREVWKRLIDVVEDNPNLERRVTGRMDAINREFLAFGKGAEKQTIKLKARRASGSRGFSADCLLLDEAQILGKRAWGSIVPTMSARPNPQLWLFGTPPTEDDDPFAFARVRESAMRRRVRHCWLEWSAEPDDDFNDPATWAKANPSYGVRISEEACADDRSAMDDEQFGMERLGIWPDAERSAGFFGVGQWSACKVARSGIVSDLAFGVAVSVGGGSSAIAAAGRNAEGLLHVELVKRADGTDWLAPDLAMLVPEHRAGTVAIDGKGPSSVIIPELGGVPLTVLETSDVLDAAALAVDRVARREVVHLGDPELEAAVRGARPRPVGDRFAVGRRNSGSDVCAFEAAVIALWAVERQANYDVLDSIL